MIVSFVHSDSSSPRVLQDIINDDGSLKKNDAYSLFSGLAGITAAIQVRKETAAAVAERNKERKKQKEADEKDKVGYSWKDEEKTILAGMTEERREIWHSLMDGWIDQHLKNVAALNAGHVTGPGHAYFAKPKDDPYGFEKPGSTSDGDGATPFTQVCVIA